MKAVTYRHNWGSNLTDEEERKKLFGTLLYEVTDAEPYTVESAHLYKNGRVYTLLEANGCSCWDGDYDGWEFTKKELVDWASAKSHNQEYDWRRQNFELLADWIWKNRNNLTKKGEQS